MAHAAGLQTASCALLFRPEPSPVPADSSIRDVLPGAMMMAAIIVATRRNPISTALGECDGQTLRSGHRHVHLDDAFLLNPPSCFVNAWQTLPIATTEFIAWQKGEGHTIPAPCAVRAVAFYHMQMQRGAQGQTWVWFMVCKAEEDTLGGSER